MSEYWGLVGVVGRGDSFTYLTVAIRQYKPKGQLKFRLELHCFSTGLIGVVQNQIQILQIVSGNIFRFESLRCEE